MADFLSGLGDALGSVPGLGLIGGATNLLGGILAQNSSATSVQQQEQFQEQESNTAYQRSRQDMEKAGLNPVLMASQGGASTPSGTSMQYSNLLGGATQSALSAMQTGQQMDQAQSNIANTNAKTNLLNAQSKALTSSAKSSAVSKEAGSVKDTADSTPYRSWFGQHILPWWDVLTGHVSASAKAVQDVGETAGLMLGE